MENSLNIINLIEKNSTIRLSSDYENRLINKIKNNFSEDQQKLFVSSFYCYIKYESKKDFIINFDNVWKWVGFTRKDSAKKLLEKYFIIDIDYIIKKISVQVEGVKAAPPIGGAGLNKEEIMLSVNTFKKFCLKANTKKADEIHDYYIKLEELLHETINEETDELRDQLKIKDKNLFDLSEKHFKLEENHKRMVYKRVKHKLKKGNCLYILKNEKDIVQDDKCDYIFGVTKNLNCREQTYYSYLDPCFVYIMFTNENIFLESCIKKKYREVLKNSERIKNVDINEIIYFVEKMAIEMNIEFTSHRNIDEIMDKDDFVKDESGEEEIVINDINEIINDLKDESNEDETVTTLKKCNKCLIERDIDTCFSKDKSKKDGFHTTCKICEKESKMLYKIRKEKEFVELKEKKCNICRNVKDILQFTKHLYTKDGYVNNCLECSKAVINKSRKDSNIKYKCGNCEKEYSRKDTLNNHIKNCH